jgi:hypothetical protein
VTNREVLGRLTGVGRYADHLAGAPVAVAQVTPVDSGRGSRSLLWDLGRAAQNMVLAAWELGIGSAPATVFDFDLAAQLLGLPEGQRCHYLLSFGYPADPSVLTAPNKKGGLQAARGRGSPRTLVGTTPSRVPSRPGKWGRIVEGGGSCTRHVRIGQRSSGAAWVLAAAWPNWSRREQIGQIRGFQDATRGFGRARAVEVGRYVRPVYNTSPTGGKAKRPVRRPGVPVCEWVGA